MKWVCLMANMTLPGVGTLICKRWVSGAIQTVGSIIGFTLLGYCIYEFYHALQNYSDQHGWGGGGYFGSVKALKQGMMEPLVTGAVGVIILKVMWIWAQVTTAQVFKAEKAAEAQEAAAGISRSAAAAGFLELMLHLGDDDALGAVLGVDDDVGLFVMRLALGEQSADDFQRIFLLQ